MKRIKDIGSIFPLYEADLEAAKGVVSPIRYQNRIHYSLCREAMWVIGQHHNKSNHKLIVPAYTCLTVYKSFVELGWDIYFYPVTKDLRINIEAFRQLFNEVNPAIVIAHPYFGMDFNAAESDALKEAHNAGSIVVVDLTQCILSKQRFEFVDYYVGSYRKWTGMVDGGFLEVADETKLAQFENEMPYNDQFVWMQKDSMFLRGEYFLTGNDELKQISRRLNGFAVTSARIKTQPHRMADISYATFLNEDWQKNEKQRFANYRTLHDAISKLTQYKLVCPDIDSVTTAPLYFTIYTENRTILQRTLAQNNIYAPVIWPLATEDMLINEDIRYIYDNVLSIPCDQRYDQDDMNRVLSIINEYSK